jgi:general secretion pathway protein D
MSSRRADRLRQGAGLRAWRAAIGLTAAAALIAVSACASSSAFRAGKKAETLEDFDLAVVEYTKAVRQRPDDLNAKLALERARQRAALDHFAKGRRLAGTGKLEEGVIELQTAAELNPASGDIQEQLRQARNLLRSKVAVTREGKTRLQTLIENASTLPAQGADLPKGVKLADSLVFRNANTRDVFMAIGHFGGINVVFDPQFRDQPITIDLRNTLLEDALQAVTASTRNFYRVTAPNTITVIPDSPAKRREYEEEIIRTFYLSNADVKETLDVLRLVVDNRRLSPVQGINAITIKDTPEKIEAAAKVISAIDKARAEVVIDVELLEVDRIKMRDYGLEIATPGTTTGGVSGSVDVNRDNFTLRDLRSLTQGDVFLTGVPALFYRLLKNDTHSRVLANPQLRTSEGLTAQARFGERVPVPSVTFAPIATGGVNQQPITSFSYEPIGVNIDLTPRLHHNDEVSLTVKIEVSNVSGTGFQDLPTFGNRSISTTIRLKDGETNMLAGLIRDDERRSLSGMSGLADVPVIGRLFARNSKETQQTDIILMLTPRIIRVLELTEADLRPFRVGRTDNAGGTIDLPLPQQPSVPGGPPRDPAPRDQQKPPEAAPAELGPPGLPQPRTRPTPSTPGASTLPPVTTTPSTPTTPPTTPPPVRPPD